MVIDTAWGDWDSEDLNTKNSLISNNNNMVAGLDGPNGTFLKSTSGRRNTQHNTSNDGEQKLERKDELIPLLQPRLIVDKSAYVAIFQKIGAYISGTEQREGKLTYNAFRDAGLQEFIKGITHHEVDSRGIITNTNKIAGRPLFTINEVYTFGDTYTLIDTEGNAFEVKIDDFNQHGFRAVSLDFTDDLSHMLVGEEKNTQKAPVSKVVKTKVVKLENMIAGLQDKMDIKDFKELTPFLHKFYGVDIETDGNKLRINRIPDSGLIKKLEFFRSGYYTNGSYTYRGFSYPIKLHAIISVYTQDDYYVFNDESGNTFHVNITDFDKNGNKAPSLKLGKPPLGTPSNLVRDFTLESTHTSINLLKNGSIVSTIVGDQFVVVNKEQGYVIVVNENLLEYMQIDENAQQIPQNHPIAHPYGEIQKIKIDKNSNFLLIVSKYNDAKHKLHIVNRVTLEEIESHDGIVDIIEIDNKNDLTCLDNEGKLVSIDTNFDKFPVGFVDGDGIIVKKEIITIKNAALADLENILDNGTIQVDAENIASTGAYTSSIDADKKVVIEKIWNIPVGKYTLKELFDKANSRDDITLLENALAQIASNPAVSAIPNITDSIENDIEQRRIAIEKNIIASTLENIKDTFATIKNNPDKENDIGYFPALLTLQNELESLKKYRGQFSYIESETDTRIKQTFEEIQAEILEYRLKNIATAKESIKINIEKLSTEVNALEYLSQIPGIYGLPLYQDTQKLIDFLESEGNIFKDEIKTIIKQKIESLQAEIAKKEKEAKEKLEKQVYDIESDIENLESIIKNIDSVEELTNIRKRNTLIEMIETSIAELPKAEGEKLTLALNQLFETQKQTIRLKKSRGKGVIVSLDEYSIDTSLYYTETKKKNISYSLHGTKTKDGNLKLALHYEDGSIFDFDTYLVNPMKYASSVLFDEINHEISQSDFIKTQKNLSDWLKKGKKELSNLRITFSKSQNEQEKNELGEKIKALKKYYESARSIEAFALHLAQNLNLNPRAKLELPNPRFIVLDEEKEILHAMSSGFSIQRQEQKGIDILEGPPGLGKTEICKFFAAITGREIVRIQCSKMDPSDLFFAPQLKAGETTRQPAEWIQYLQKPGTIILFDEIDKLNPQSFERLHSLFDGARAVYDPQIGWIKAHSDALLVGTRNSYEKMSNPIVSRSVIIEIKAPSKENESFKVSKYTGEDFFENLEYTPYNNLKQTASEPWIVERLGQIEALVNIFSDLRLAQRNDDEAFEYEISYRDAEQIFQRYKKMTKPDFKKITKEVLLPKAKAVVLDSEDKTTQAQIVEAIIDKYL